MKYVKGQRVVVLPEQEGEISRPGVITSVGEHYGVRDDEGDIWEVPEEYLGPEESGCAVIVHNGKRYYLTPVEYGATRGD